ncbi:MAG TPA: sigma-54 dependent transcriptional regulator [Syntrophorhabdaceae bacterium]|nr:sigma-54 dependent transcriptional regulator [Syntrophorhabdaceae bacterium]HQM80254.1 sigma-54 dependent transcriptional regulator [Syntrophorhabdaceae bacterium]
MPDIRVLVVDDEEQLAEAFRKKLSKEGYAVDTAPTGGEAVSLVKQRPFDVCVLDIRLPDIDGVKLLETLKEMEPTLEIIMLTGHASIDTAIQSMKRGAYDYLSKPCKLSELSSIILKAYEKKSLKERNIVLQEQLQRVEAHDTFIGESKQIKEVQRLISLVAPSDVPVLVLGETGTGKELVARAIHAMSPRSANQFVAVNSSTLQESILESELFGYKKGAFTGAQNDKIGLLELANRGTFFIDEVGDMGINIQAKFLRTLETGVFRRLGDTRESKVDVRFIFATNKPLEDEIKEKKFRKDLFYRLNTFVIALPSLRERKDDILLLADYFLGKFARGGDKKVLSDEAMKLLSNYWWPGNVRELANVIERAVLLSMVRKTILCDDLPQTMMESRPENAYNGRMQLQREALDLEKIEKEHIRRVLELAEGNKSKAARLLGISRKKLYQKIGVDR